MSLRIFVGERERKFFKPLALFRGYRSSSVKGHITKNRFRPILTADLADGGRTTFGRQVQVATLPVTVTVTTRVVQRKISQFVSFAFRFSLIE
jgi:hypothetical protein